MCAFDSPQARRFVLRKDAPVEAMPYGKDLWICGPDLVATRHLLVVEVEMTPGTGHGFHRHPGREEVLWVIEGQGEQWVERDKKVLGPGDSAFIAPGIVHGIYNDSSRLLRFLAVLSPAELDAPMLIDVAHEEPWATLRNRSL